METNSGSVDVKMGGVIEGLVKERGTEWMRPGEGRMEGGSDLCATETSTEGGNEGMTDDEKVKRHKATRVMEIQVRKN